MTLTDLLARFDDVVEQGDGFLVSCPAHADAKPSLRLSVGQNGKLLVKCRAGCQTGDVLKKLGLSFADLQDAGESPVRARSTAHPATPGAIASLALQLDGYASALSVSPHTDHDGHVRDALAYAERRFGLSLGDCQRLGLGYATDLGGGPRLVVPFRVGLGDAPAHGFQARALDADASVRWLGPRSPEGGGSWSKVAVFSGSASWEELIVTEGPGDGLTACAVGYDSVAVRGAALAERPEVVEAILGVAGPRPIVVFGDLDDSGERFARTLVARLTAAGASVAVVGRPGAEDVTAWREADPSSFASAFVAEVERAVAQAPSAVRARLDAFTVQDLTDLGMAKRLRTRILADGSDVRFTPEVGFYLLRDGVWRPDALDAVRTTAQSSAEALWTEADSIEELLDELPDSAETKAARKRLGRLRSFARHANSSRGLDSMIRELQALRGVATDVNRFDRHAHLLACRNGVVNLRTGELEAHDPELLMTRLVDLDFDPAATAPRWERFLEEVFPTHPELPAYIQRLVGYGVTGETAEQAFAVLWGKGANGKSVFTDTLTEVFRELTVTTPFSTFEHRPSGGIPNDLAALKGSRLVMAAEGEQGRPMAEAVLKRVTGRDLISARFMRREFFEFRPTFLLLLASNFKPSFRGQDEGLWRRVKLIPWERYFRPEERDHKLGDQLLAEAPGVLAWSVRGAVSWYAGGLRDPEVVRGATKEYRETSDALAGFFPGVFVRDSEGHVAGSTAFDAYLRWCEEENLQRGEVWTRRTFYGAMEERGAERRKTNRGVELVGLRRARATELEPAHDEPERVDEPELADSSPVLAPPSGGFDLEAPGLLEGSPE